MLIYLAVAIFRMHLDGAYVSLSFMKWAGAQLSIVKLNMVNMSLKLYVIYVYAVMYFY